MHFDRRGYAYETFREGGRVCRRYVGSGDVVGAVLWLDERDRQEREEKRAAASAQIERAARGTEELKAFCAASDKAFRASMEASGFHRIKRGPWRKARAHQARNPMAKPKTLTKLAPDAEHQTLIQRASDGDEDAARQVVEQVKGQPEEGPMLELLASFSEVASEALIQGITKNELRRAGFRRQLEVMRDELAGPKPSPLELHLAERVALCALSVSRLERLFEGNVSSSPKVWEVCGRQLDGAHRRHLSAVRTLAEVRRLQLPNVQVNIGEKQVNIGQVNAPEK